MFKRIASLLLISLMAACGGSGDGGTSVFGGSGTGTGGTTTGVYKMSIDVQRVGASTSQISSTETAQAVATVTSSAGSPIQGAVVTFSQSAATLLTFAPNAATALTGADGRAIIDISATTSAGLGAVTIEAKASVNTVSLSATKSIQITAGTTTPGVVATPAAINFVSTVPSATAIVVKGAGGNGRSESAILTFRIVDASNAPINAAVVNFTLNTDNGGATIASPVSATSNSDGLVTVTIASGISPASIVVTAKSQTVASVTSQSDTLIVSNSVPVVGGFEIVAAKYNLDGRKTGDSTTITAFVRDEFGNPVPDGVAVSFQTDYGVIALSTLGGCATVNGTCTVQFRVQDPRGDGIATVRASVRVGTANTLSGQLQINMAAATGTSYVASATAGGAPVPSLTMSSCKQVFELALSDGHSPNGRSTAAGTIIAAGLTSSNLAVSVKAGSPVLDQLGAGFPPTGFGIEVDASSTSLAPVCKPAGVVAASPLFFNLQYTSPGGIVYVQRIALSYPQ